MSVQPDAGDSWKGHTKHTRSLLYRPKHVQFPDWLGNHRLHTAVKKREMPRIIPSSYHNVCFSDIDNDHETCVMFFYVFVCIYDVEEAWDFRFGRFG